MNITASEIERIVRDVLKSMASSELVLATANPLQSTVSSPKAAVSLGDAVIGLEALRAIPTGITSIQVPSQAVVTPAARDWLRDRGVSLARGTAMSAKPVPVVASATIPQVANPSTPPSPARLFIAGAVDWLPGLSKQLCPKQSRIAERVADDASAVRAIAVAIRSGYRSGLALVDAPHSALWQAARDELMRPAVVSQWSDLAEIFREVPVNLLIVPSKRWGIAGTANIARRFLVHVGSQS